MAGHSGVEGAERRYDIMCAYLPMASQNLRHRKKPNYALTEHLVDQEIFEYLRKIAKAAPMMQGVGGRWS